MRLRAGIRIRDWGYILRVSLNSAAGLDIEGARSDVLSNI